MKKRWKKPAVAAAVLLLVCAAVYMNWRYTDDIQKNAGKTLGQTTLVSSQDGEKGTEPTAAPAEDDYFATARLSRKQARDNAISMLKEAERDENAQQSVLNEASQTLQVLAAYTVAESQIESLVTAKGYADCVVLQAMADNKEYMTHQESMGTIQISEDVVASIATSACLEVEGVGGLMNANVSDYVTGKKMTAKGIRVEMDGEGIVVNLFILLRYGCAVSEVAQKVQSSVFAALEGMTGFQVNAVNVHVGGISFD